MDTDQLQKWFLETKRDLPWRREPTPYAVWVSEVMLQQTQVAVVIPYFLRWMELFPTIKALAEAPIEKVIKCWEGLGYYSRARNLHQGANQLVREHGGKLPEDEKALSQIKGLGPYTIGAIRCFAFGHRAPVVDGNVARVLARFYGIEEPIDTGSTAKRLRELAYAVLPENEPWHVAEGLIELGATVCKRKAECENCPLQQCCIACNEGLTTELPKRRPRPQTTDLHRAVMIYLNCDHVLLQRGEEGKIMAGLYEFPYIEIESKNFAWDRVKRHISRPVELIRPLKQCSHTFTRYRAHLYPFLVKAERQADEEWHPVSALQTLPFSSGHRRILKQVI